MQLNKQDEKAYKSACKEIEAYNKLKEDKKTPIIEQYYRANLIIQQFGAGLKRGDKFIRESTGKELKSLLEVTHALKDNDLIIQPVQKLSGTGG